MGRTQSSRKGMAEVNRTFGGSLCMAFLEMYSESRNGFDAENRDTIIKNKPLNLMADQFSCQHDPLVRHTQIL